jgi:hypothetical protein
MEFQERGAPHFHVLINQAVSRVWLSQVWYRVVGSGDVRHMVAGTRSEPLRELHAAAAYASKYAAKQGQKDVPEGFTDVGRFWGVFNTSVKPEHFIDGPNRSGGLAPDALDGPDRDLWAARGHAVRQVVRFARRLVEKARARMGYKKRRIDNGVSGFTAYDVAGALRSLIASVPPLPSLPSLGLSSDFDPAGYVSSGQFSSDLSSHRAANRAALEFS